MSEKTNGKQRTTNGQFAPGNKGGPGNPFARQTAALRKAAMESASAQDVAEVMAALKLRAQAGDVAAARLWLAYAVGKPGPSADPDTLDSHELEVRRQNVATEEDMKALFEKLPASMMCDLAGAVAPHVRERMGQTLAEGIRRQGEAGEKTGPEPEPARNGPRLPEKGEKLFEAFPADVLRGMPTGLPGGVKEGNDARVVSRPKGRQAPVARGSRQR